MTPASDPPRFSLKKHSYEVSIKVDGEAVPIYKTQYFPEARKLIGWIPSQGGQEYSVCMKQNLKFNHTTAADLYTDGRKSCDTVFGKDYGFEDELAGIAVSSTVSRAFSFKKLETTDDLLVLGKDHGFDTPGVIEVRMNRVKIVETGQENSWEDYSPQVPERDLLVHESEHKAGTHVMQLGEEKPSDNVRIFTLPLEPSDEEPWAIFEFQYRPASVLQAKGIMPKPPNQATTPSKRRGGNRTIGNRELAHGSQRSVRGVTQAGRARSTRRTRSSTISSLDELDVQKEAARNAKLLVIEAMQAALDAQLNEYREEYGNIGLPSRYLLAEENDLTPP